MSEQDEGAEKSFDPTPKKLEDARKKGELVKSTDVSTAAVYAALAFVGAGFGATSIEQIGTSLTQMIGQAPELSTLVFEGSTHAIMGGLLLSIAPAIALWLVVPGIAAVLSIIAQRAMVFAPSKLQPKLNKISLIQNLKNKFGRNGLFEFAKSFVKLLIYSTVLSLFLKNEFEAMLVSMSTSPGTIAAMMLSLCLQFLLVVIVVSVAIAGVDYTWQHFEHIRKNMMTRKEVMDEMKQSEGDPHMKQQRRQRGQEIAMTRALDDVPGADVVIVNPTHYAVALKWSRQPGEAPVCLAKGIDEIALRIRSIANEHGVPIHHDPPTARALHATVELGEEIRDEHYVAVAAAIRFSENMRKKAKGRAWTK